MRTVNRNHLRKYLVRWSLRNSKVIQKLRMSDSIGDQFTNYEFLEDPGVFFARTSTATLVLAALKEVLPLK